MWRTDLAQNSSQHKYFMAWVDEPEYRELVKTEEVRMSYRVL